MPFMAPRHEMLMDFFHGPTQNFMDLFHGLLTFLRRRRKKFHGLNSWILEIFWEKFMDLNHVILGFWKKNPWRAKRDRKFSWFYKGKLHFLVKNSISWTDFMDWFHGLLSLRYFEKQKFMDLFHGLLTFWATGITKIHGLNSWIFGKKIRKISWGGA